MEKCSNGSLLVEYRGKAALESALIIVLLTMPMATFMASEAFATTVEETLVPVADATTIALALEE